MKKIMLTIALLITAKLLFGQTNYEQAMFKGLEMLKQCQTIEKANECTNYFERISAVNKTEWLPLYYAAYSSLAAGIYANDKQIKDDYYERGNGYIEQAMALKPDESEIYALNGYLKLMFIANDAMKRAPSQTSDALELIAKSKKLNPKNPRPWFVHGQNTLYTPVFFGGGEKNAKPLLEQASEKYKSFTPVDKLMPSWGQERCEKLLAQCSQ